MGNWLLGTGRVSQGGLGVVIGVALSEELQSTKGPFSGSMFVWGREALGFRV